MEDLLNFYRNIDKIKHIERAGWIRIGVKGVRDTIASHSYGASLLGWILSKRENLDENKLIKLLLIHDLIMANIEDLTPHQSKYKSKREIENQAAKQLLDSIPSEIKEEFAELFEEYQEEKTEESILARECDKLDTLFQALFYSERLKEDRLSEFINTYKNYFRSKTGKDLFKELEKKMSKL